MAISSCAKDVGDFCDLADPLKTKNDEVGRYIIKNDQKLAVDLGVHNKLYEEKCQ